MIEKINLNNILFLDIETVPEEENFNSLDAEMQLLWDHKTQYQRKDDFTAEEFYDRAEFGPNLEKLSVYLSVILPLKATSVILE